ncbi:hypothetical protein [Streptomyces sp. ISL-94]|uniref:hypothetical protein n=1 Tax=Streptomyces sp. ISL-94 TaxID=2819190 RepID=UPI001BE597A0|nr:hypothetical protein [Streptomyces sp. ISL-94]MBT2481267.1 hypothetical protein [Streptomyces sp. ISL-94]
MEQTGTDQMLASKWDLPFVLGGMLRLAFANLPDWVKLTVFGIIGSVAVWTAVTWLRERGRRGT